MIPVSECVREGSLLADQVRQREELAAAGLPVPRFEVVRSAWGAALCAERLGGWPLILKSAGTIDGRTVHHVADAREAAWVLENGDREPWVAQERIAADAVVTVVVVPTPDGLAADPALLDVDRWRGRARQGPGLDAELESEAIAVAERAAALVGDEDAVRVELLVRRNRVLVEDVTAHRSDSSERQLQLR